MNYRQARTALSAAKRAYMHAVTGSYRSTAAYVEAEQSARQKVQQAEQAVRKAHR